MSGADRNPAQADPSDPANYSFSDLLNPNATDVQEFAKTSLVKDKGWDVNLLNSAAKGHGRNMYLGNPEPGYVSPTVNGKIVDVNDLVSSFVAWKAQQDTSNSSYNDYRSKASTVEGRDKTILTGPQATLLAGATQNPTATPTKPRVGVFTKNEGQS
jgi:hypothetical protein